MARNIKFSPDAWNEYAGWEESDPEVYGKLKELIKETARDLFKGRGKPEPLKHKTLQGYWSRRITKADRLVYKGDDNDLYILSCRGHY